MDKLKNNADETNTSMSMVDAMASATLSGAVTAGYMSASNAAGNYSDTMVRLGYALSGTSMRITEWYLNRRMTEKMNRSPQR